MRMPHYSADCLCRVAVYAKEFGVNIGLEPVNRYETYLVNTWEQALKLKEMIGEIRSMQKKYGLRDSIK